MTSTTDVESGKGGGSLAFPDEQAPANNVSAPNCNRKKIILAAIASLALIGLIVGLSVGLTRGRGSGASNEEPALVTSQFTETKAFMDEVCKNEDKTLCEEKCEPVACCNPFAEDSCLMENAEKCMEYAMCHVVKEAEARGAPGNLTDICLLDDKTECTKACQDVKCCFDSTEKCQDTQFLTCVDYAACQRLGTATIEPASADLWKTCADSDKRDDCEKECAEASCCWDKDANCLATDMITCMTYAPCGALVLEVPNSVVNRPAETFQDDCSVDSVLTGDGYENCADQCQEASCCSAEGEENCFMKDPIGCLQHLQCGLLAFAGGNVPKADTEKLTAECNVQDMLSTGSFSEDCKTACEPAECCIAQGDDNCLVDGNTLACASYLPCLPVFMLGDFFNGDGFNFGDFFDGNGFDFSDMFGGNSPLFGNSTYEAPPDDLQTTCINDLDECEKLCEDVKCCMTMGDDNCLLENLITCATWNLQGCLAVNGFQQA